MKDDIQRDVTEWLRFVKMDQDKDTDAIRTAV